jgi:hypothetical protein
MGPGIIPAITSLSAPFGGGTVPKSRFLRRWRLNRGAEKETDVKTGGLGKRCGPEKAQGEAKVRQEMSPRGRQVREKLRAKGYTRCFLCPPVLAASQIVSRPRRHPAGCRRGCFPLSLHSQNGRFDPTYYPAIVCAGQSRAAWSPGGHPDGAGGKKRKRLRQKCRTSDAFRRPAPPTPGQVAKHVPRRSPSPRLSPGGRGGSQRQPPGTFAARAALGPSQPQPPCL